MSICQSVQVLKKLKMSKCTRTSLFALLFAFGSHQWQGIGCMYDARSLESNICHGVQHVMYCLSFISEYIASVDSEHGLISMPW